MFPSFELQCLSCGAIHTLAPQEVPADGPAALANRGRECPDCALHGRPRFPLWRYRAVPEATEREKAAIRNRVEAGLRAWGGRRTGAGRKPIADAPLRRVDVRLTDPDIAYLRERGDGNLSEGARRVITDARSGND